VQRHLRIATRIFPRAKDEARHQQLDNNQTALLTIAAEETEEAQRAVARTWRFRKVGSGCVRKQQEFYKATLPENMPDKHRRKLDRIMKLVSSRFRVDVVHAEADPDSDRPD